MKEYANHFPIEKMASTLKVSVSGYYAYNKRKPSLREEENRRFLGLIKAIYKKGRGMYGSPRVHAKLKNLHIKCSRKRVARLMRANNIAAKMRKSWKTTTKQGRRPAANNLLKQDFKASSPNEKWVSDITYIKTSEGWLYVAAILDLFSRRVVGLSMGERLATLLEKSSKASLVSQKAS